MNNYRGHGKTSHLRQTRSKFHQAITFLPPMYPTILPFGHPDIMLTEFSDKNAMISFSYNSFCASLHGPQRVLGRYSSWQTPASSSYVVLPQCVHDLYACRQYPLQLCINWPNFMKIIRPVKIMPHQITSGIMCFKNHSSRQEHHIGFGKFWLEATNAELQNFIYDQLNECASVEKIFFCKYYVKLGLGQRSG